MAASCSCGNELRTQTITVVDGTPKCGVCWRDLDEYALENTSMARRFEPCLVFEAIDSRNPVPFDFPGRNNEECPPGYKPVVIDTLRAADQFATKYNRIEGERGRTERALNHLYFDQRTKERRDSIRARIRGNAKAEALFREVCARMDAKRDVKRSQQMRWEPNGNFQVFSRDSSNRQGWADRETGWKEKRS